MLIHSVVITNFRCIGHARIEFDRGLNVLHGPNELGKSTVIEAIRAALLLPSTSSEGRHFVPWGTDSAPEVVVEFETLAAPPKSPLKATSNHSKSSSGVPAAHACTATRWRISKVFCGPRGSAFLERIVGKGRAIEEAKGRDVDGRLRALLGWGLLAPGGKGASRGFPDSYLTTALLGEQDKVTAMLTASLDADKEGSGRGLLTDALGALSRNPLIVKILKRLEAQTAEVYTKTGQQRRTRDNPLAQLAENIRQQETRVQKLQEQTRQSDDIERQVAELKHRENELCEKLDRDERDLSTARAVDTAQKNLREAMAHQRVLDQAAQQLKSSEDDLQGATVQHEELLAAVKRCHRSLANAREDAARIAEAQKQAADRAAEKRKVRLAELSALVAQLRTHIHMAEELENAHRLVLTREKEAETSRGQYDAAQQELKRVKLVADTASLIERRRDMALRLEAANAARRQREICESAERDAIKALHEATESLDVAESALAQDREHIQEQQLDLRRAEDLANAFRTKLLNAQTLEERERKCLHEVRQLVQAEQDVVERQESIKRLDEQLSETEQSIVAYETQDTTLKAAIHRQVLILIGGAVLALGAITSGIVMTTWRWPLIIFGVVLLAGLTKIAFSLFQATQNRTALTAKRERQRDKRGELSVRRVMADEQLVSCRRIFEQARGRVPTALFQIGLTSSDGRVQDTLLEQAESRWQQARETLKRVEAESQAASPQEQPAAAQEALTQLQSRHEERARQMRQLKLSLSERQEVLNKVRQELSAVREREKIAAQRAEDVNLDQLTADINSLLSEGGIGEANIPDRDDAVAAAEEADQLAREAKTECELADRRLDDARAAWNACISVPAKPTEEPLESLRVKLTESESQLEQLEAGVGTDSDQKQVAQQMSEATKAVEQCERELATKEAELKAAAERLCSATDKRDQARLEQRRLEGKESAPDVAQRIADLRVVLDSAEPVSAELPHSVEVLETTVNQDRHELQQVTAALQKAHGQLEHVGGSVIRDELAREQEQLEQLKGSASELELEYEATRRLYDRLTDADARHAVHLGRQLSGPVREKFLELTDDRYHDVLLAPDLAVNGVEAGGATREVSTLSVGTQDQLATLIRLSIAAHLKTTLLLDDQLAHSDPQRMIWLRNCLRDSVVANSHQIIVATCRPEHYIDTHEAASDSKVFGKLKIREIDLGLLVRGATAQPTRGSL